ncbi:diacylglycerol kinase family protein [Proteinivorax hydrogeniformans]|uniref:Diacylglycerol kinase family protein n=1 Tax=Proteinivorax hydrogeniformans TaxID=1826727 RepID=A0AAU8HUV6_9FIRM
MKEFFFVINPKSANGSTAQYWPRIKEMLQDEKYDFDYQLTSAPNQADEIAMEAIRKGYEKIVAVGGDGTVNEVVNGFFLDDGSLVNPKAKLGIISRGTGCDFIRTMGIPKDVKYAIRALKSGKAKPSDVIEGEYISQQGQKIIRRCINISDVGLGGFVVRRVNHTTKSSGGFLSYLLGTLLSVLKCPTFDLEIILDNKLFFSGEVYLAAVANGKYLGGGMKLAPEAILDDGLLDLVLVKAMTKPRLLWNLRKVYSGTHLSHPKIAADKCKTVTVRSLNGDMPLEMDGETGSVKSINYKLNKEKIEVICE